MKVTYQVWEAVCSTVKKVVEEAAVSKDQVVGIGFDATCSLVLVGHVSLLYILTMVVITMQVMV